MTKIKRDNGWEHTATDDPVCPYCLEEQSDFWEVRTDSDDSYPCNSCGRPFSYEREISVTYTTRPIMGPHHLSEWEQAQDAKEFPLESTQ